MKRIVCETMLIFTSEVIEHVTSTCWFVSSFDDSWAFALKGDELQKHDHLIFLSDELLSEPMEQIRFTICHEIGHVILEHKNAILIPQTKREIAKQEKEADEFAKFYLKKG